MKKVYLLIGGAVGFVLGSRAGRGPYEQLEAKVRRTAHRPEVQSAVDQAKSTVDQAKSTVDQAKSTVDQATSTARDQAINAAKAIGDKLPGSTQESEGPGTSTAAGQEQTAHD